MAFLSLNTNASSSITTFTFTTPIKLDKSNYTIWKSQILSSVRSNELESLLDGLQACPYQFLTGDSSNADDVVQENPTYVIWNKQDQMLLSWLLSSIKVEILSLGGTSKTSNELWTSLEPQFGSETTARKVHLKMMLNNLKKESMTVTDYFSKLRSITDELAIVGNLVSFLDFITHLIPSLGQPYYPVVVFIEANILKMSINEAYSMLLTHKARLQNVQSTTSKEAKLNYAANIAQARNNQKRAGNNVGYNTNSQGNFVQKNGNNN